MITHRKAAKVARRFKRIANEYADRSAINMDEMGLNKSECGTVACHAGWYAIAKLGECAYEEYRGVWWQAGASRIAEDLGFDYPEELENWAHLHPEIWGNEHGLSMFNSRLAFHTPEREIWEEVGLQEIADHWKGVAKRLREAEKQDER